ncbi:MAG: hypothetical protein ACLRS8_18315 [Parabacteroides merdae]
MKLGGCICLARTGPVSGFLLLSIPALSDVPISGSWLHVLPECAACDKRKLGNKLRFDVVNFAAMGCITGICCDLSSIRPTILFPVRDLHLYSKPITEHIRLAIDVLNG